MTNRSFHFLCISTWMDGLHMHPSTIVWLRKGGSVFFNDGYFLWEENKFILYPKKELIEEVTDRITWMIMKGFADVNEFQVKSLISH